jgi:hypothetical protein
MHILKPYPHGYIDYAAILLLAVAPGLVGFGGTAATLCYVLAALYLGLVVLTAYPLGVVKVVPFTVHGAVELILAPVLAALPWIAGFADMLPARRFYLVMAFALAGVWLVTDYKAAERDPRSHRPRRSHA